MEAGAGEDQAVDVGDGQADGHAVVGASGRAQGAGARRAVYVQALADPSVQGRQDNGHAVADEAEVADVSRVEYRVHEIAVVRGAVAASGRPRTVRARVRGARFLLRALFVWGVFFVLRGGGHGATPLY